MGQDCLSVTLHGKRSLGFCRGFGVRALCCHIWLPDFIHSLRFGGKSRAGWVGGGCEGGGGGLQVFG